MLINVADEEESRVAIVEDGILEEFTIEVSTKEQIRGNISPDSMSTTRVLPNVVRISTRSIGVSFTSPIMTASSPYRVARMAFRTALASSRPTMAINFPSLAK